VLATLERLNASFRPTLDISDNNGASRELLKPFRFNRIMTPAKVAYHLHR
jgi:hypothetical protein